MVVGSSPTRPTIAGAGSPGACRARRRCSVADKGVEWAQIARATAHAGPVQVVIEEEDGASMFGFFKRSSETAGTPALKAASRSSPPKPNDRRGQSGPLPVPEVTEGNDDSDWALWEDSVSFQNSQLPGMASTTKSVSGTQQPCPVASGSTDAFDSVHKHAP